MTDGTGQPPVLYWIESQGRNYIVKNLDGKILRRNLSALVDANANKFDQTLQVIDLFQLPK